MMQGDQSGGYCNCPGAYMKLELIGMNTIRWLWEYQKLELIRLRTGYLKHGVERGRCYGCQASDLSNWINGGTFH